MNWKEVFKFASGVTAWEAVVHASLLISGTTITLFGITLDMTVNIIQTIIPSAVTATLVYYSWIKK